MSAATDIFNYFTPIEEALSFAFARYEITCYTPLGESLLNEAASAAPPDLRQQFQKKRPRVELLLLPAGNLGRLRPPAAAAARRVAAGFLYDQARRASLIVHIITKAEILEHRAFLGEVLFRLETIGRDANAGDKLPCHALSRLAVGGGSLNYKSEEGLFETTLNCELDFSVKETAWTALDAELAQ